MELRGGGAAAIIHRTPGPAPAGGREGDTDGGGLGLAAALQPGCGAGSGTRLGFPCKIEYREARSVVCFPLFAAEREGRREAQQASTITTHHI